MNLFDNFSWRTLLVSTLICIIFYWIHKLRKANKVPITVIYIICLTCGLFLGAVFPSTDLILLNLISDIYLKVIKLCIAPLVLVSLIWTFIQIGDLGKVYKITTKSIFWLIAGSLVVLIITGVVGLSIPIGIHSGSLFDNWKNVEQNFIQTDLYSIILNIFPENILGAIHENNIINLIIISLMISIAFISVEKSLPQKANLFMDMIEVTRSIIFKILSFIVSLTPYVIITISATNLRNIISNDDVTIDLINLVILMYLLFIITSFGINMITLKFRCKVNPFKFYKKLLPAIFMAEATQSSITTLPLTIKIMKKRLGVRSDIAEFTPTLGTNIGMPAATVIWPTLLVIFYINAMGINWGISQYILFLFMIITSSVVCVGVPSAAIVISMTLFSALGLPPEVVMIFLPINVITDIGRTVNNMLHAATATMIVAKDNDAIDLEIYNSKEDQPLD